MKLPFVFRKTSGFTLIELLIVMAIIAILISIGLASFNRAQQQARDSQRKANIEQIRGALEQYYSDYNVYPSAPGDLVSAPNGEVYLRVIPPNPSGGNYTFTGGGQNYCISVDLEIDPTTGPTCDANDYGLTAQD